MFYAKWTASTYSITYELYNGTNSAGTPLSYTYGDGHTCRTFKTG
jgi:hypothetical protein